MNEGDGPSLVWGIVALIMVASSLAARRLPLGQTLKMALAWVAIFAGLFVVFSFRPEIKAVWQRVTSDFSGTANQDVKGGTITLTRGDNGHFELLATANGKPMKFMVDTGASDIAVSSESAAAAGIEVDKTAFPIFFSTANGTSKAYRAKIDVLTINSLEFSDQDISVSDTLGDINLLGMTFLNQFRSWRVEGNKMILER
jgi:aspartyl protease family protein